MKKMTVLITAFVIAFFLSVGTFAQKSAQPRNIEKQDVQEQVVDLKQSNDSLTRPFVRRQYQRRDLSCSPNFVCDSIPKGTGYKATGVRRPYNEGRKFDRAPRYNQDRAHRYYRNRR